MERWVELDPNSVLVQALRQKAPEYFDLVFPKQNPEQRLEFGTAGLRAEFGPGLLRMNEVVVMQTCFGILYKLLSEFGPDQLRERGICVGYDHRESKEWGLSSKRFALVAAAVFQPHTKAINVFDSVNPTPFVPFGVQEFGSLAGFMFTASHNPKQDAGFKVYWSNACQITSPLDTEIRKLIMEHLGDKDLSQCIRAVAQTSEQALCDKYLTKGLFANIQAKYVAAVSTSLYRQPVSVLSHHRQSKICYTAMHGCGQHTAMKVFERFGLSNTIVPVPSQAEPDFNFPTVPFPNPEEVGALDVAMHFASQQQPIQCELILANDPDADRLGVAEAINSDGEGKWYTLSGDEIAMLLAWWEIKHMDRGNGKPKAMVVSAVSSAFLQAMGKAHGVEVFEALTGFKWIGAKAIELRKRGGYQVLLSYEEAIGFCVGSNVCDKDGMSAAAVFAQLYLDLRSRGLTCLDKLDELRKQHGYYLTQNLYLKLLPVQQQALFAQLRQYPQVVGQKRPRNVVRIRDLERRIDTQFPGQDPALPFASNMITFFLDEGERITLRASGTEPKLKYYVECVGSTLDSAKEKCKQVVEDVVLGDLLRVKSKA
ncbi:hypothetical protein BASA81_005524 [Batrachochytrium salamandrivorans]|nr:hypothetical protein BASA81_005524 [Batrachochytrium salamandrivorans]